MHSVEGNDDENGDHNGMMIGTTVIDTLHNKNDGDEYNIRC